MDWEQLRERTLGEVGTTLATEGVGVAGGLIGAGFVGRQIENIIMGKDTAGVQKYVMETDTWGTKFKAWAANNLPKLGIWYLLRGYAKVEPGEVITPGKEITVDAKKAFAGSVVFDTLIRVLSRGAMPLGGKVKLFGIDILGEESDRPAALQTDIQRLIQENSALRTELNKALQKIASAPALPQQTYAQISPVVRYQPVAPAPVQAAPVPSPVTKVEEVIPPTYTYAQPPPVVERERRYGFMQYETTPPIVQERQRKYGFAAGSTGNEEKSVASMFGML